MGLDPTVTNVRVFPLLEVSREELADVVGGKVARIEPVDGGLTNTIHKVTRETGEAFGVKHYAGGRDWFDTELTTLTLLHGTLPVPEIVHVDDKRLAIVYRWIEGVTLLGVDDKRGPKKREDGVPGCGRQMVEKGGKIDGRHAFVPRAEGSCLNERLASSNRRAPVALSSNA